MANADICRYLLSLFLNETDMDAGDIKEDEKPSAACKHGIPYNHKNLIRITDEIRTGYTSGVWFA